MGEQTTVAQEMARVSISSHAAMKDPMFRFHIIRVCTVLVHGILFYGVQKPVLFFFSDSAC